jgi:hypothetical protein
LGGTEFRQNLPLTFFLKGTEFGEVLSEFCPTQGEVLSEFYPIQGEVLSEFSPTQGESLWQVLSEFYTTQRKVCDNNTRNILQEKWLLLNIK